MEVVNKIYCLYCLTKQKCIENVINLQLQRFVFLPPKACTHLFYMAHIFDMACRPIIMKSLLESADLVPIL